MISLPTGTCIWLAAGVTDMQCGFQGLAAKVQTVLEENPLGGHVFIFRGRRGDLVKLLWATDDGLWLLSKRLERGRFIWPQVDGRRISLNRRCRGCRSCAVSRIRACLPTIWCRSTRIMRRCTDNRKSRRATG